jgi:hypothetical protein
LSSNGQYFLLFVETPVSRVAHCPVSHLSLFLKSINTTILFLGMVFTVKMPAVVCVEILNRLKPTTWFRPELLCYMFDTGCRNLKVKISHALRMWIHITENYSKIMNLNMHIGIGGLY